jgi:hypothetical protein
MAFVGVCDFYFILIFTHMLDEFLAHRDCRRSMKGTSLAPGICRGGEFWHVKESRVPTGGHLGIIIIITCADRSLETLGFVPPMYCRMSSGSILDT